MGPDKANQSLLGAPAAAEADHKAKPRSRWVTGHLATKAPSNWFAATPFQIIDTPLVSED